MQESIDGRVEFRPGIDHHPDDLRVASRNGKGERRRPVGVPGVDVASGGDQGRNEAGFSGAGGGAEERGYLGRGAGGGGPFKEEGGLDGGGGEEGFDGVGSDEEDGEDGVLEDVAAGGGEEAAEVVGVGFPGGKHAGEEGEGRGRRGVVVGEEEEGEGEGGERGEDGESLGGLEGEDGRSRCGDGDGHRHGVHEIGDAEGLG